MALIHNIYGKLALAFQLPAGFIVMPDVQYGYTQTSAYIFKVKS